MEEERFYHVYNRGNNRENIFKEKENYFYFLKKYDQYLSNYIDTYAYCLMPNHFHLLIRVREVNSRVRTLQTSEVFKTSDVLPTMVVKGFKDFFISYSKSINKRFSRTGSLFQPKFKKKLITDEMYLKYLIIYIHLNPVAAGFCEKISDWEFSSYNTLLGNEITKLKREEIFSWFDDKENFKYCHNAKLETDKLKSYSFDE